MIQWWDSLTLLEQSLAYVAIPATVILLLQTILLLFGIGDGHDEADFDAELDDPVTDGHDGGFDGLRLFTVRGIVAFFAVGGWLGISISRAGAGNLWSIAGALAGGFAALFIVAIFFKWVMKLQSDGTVEISSTVGRVGEVYIRIPANRSGKGKINLLLGDTLTELDAVTDCEYDLAPQTQVTVERTEGATLVVAPVNQK